MTRRFVRTIGIRGESHTGKHFCLILKHVKGLFPANFVTKEITNSKSSPRSSTKKKEENKKIVVKIDEAILDSTLTAVESADPSLLEDSPEMLENEERCSKMGTNLTL